MEVDNDFIREINYISQPDKSGNYSCMVNIKEFYDLVIKYYRKIENPDAIDYEQFFALLSFPYKYLTDITITDTKIIFSEQLTSILLFIDDVEKNKIKNADIFKILNIDEFISCYMPVDLFFMENLVPLEEEYDSSEEYYEEYDNSNEFYDDDEWIDPAGGVHSFYEPDPAKIHE